MDPLSAALPRCTQKLIKINIIVEHLHLMPRLGYRLKIEFDKNITGTIECQFSTDSCNVIHRTRLKSYSIKLSLYTLLVCFHDWKISVGVFLFLPYKS